MIKILKLHDGTTTPVEINCCEVVVETELGQYELQEKVNELIKVLEKEDENWTYDDLLNYLEKKKLIKILESDTLIIWA